MGIRIHKALGWGITNKNKVDPRFNFELFNQADFYDYVDSKFTYEGFKKFLNKKKKEDGDANFLITSLLNIIKKDELKGSFFNDFFISDDQSDINKIVCLSMPWVKEHRRYDDSLDYYECNYDFNKSSNYVKVLKIPIYPWVGYIDSRNGKRIKDLGAACLIQRSDSKKFRKENDELSKIVGFSSHKDLKKYMVPAIPEELRLLVEYTGILSDNKHLNQFKPMVYVYWG